MSPRDIARRVCAGDSGLLGCPMEFATLAKAFIDLEGKYEAAMKVVEAARIGPKTKKLQLA